RQDVVLVVRQPVLEDLRVAVTVSSVQATPHHVALRVAGLGLDSGGQLASTAVDDLDADVRELGCDDVGEDVQVVVGHARVEDEMVLVAAATAATAGCEGER